jgi:hypothetical protein
MERHYDLYNDGIEGDRVNDAAIAGIVGAVAGAVVGAILAGIFTLLAAHQANKIAEQNVWLQERSLRMQVALDASRSDASSDAATRRTRDKSGAQSQRCDASCE